MAGLCNSPPSVSVNVYQFEGCWLVVRLRNVAGMIPAWLQTDRRLKMFNRKTLTSLLIVSALGCITTGAMADTKWQNNHPRREQVNNRLANQNRRIHQERKEGDLSAAQAHALHANDRSIRAQERADAAANGGHITKAEQRQLNGELNAESRAIGK
jgi:hypothetical protein